MAVNFKKHIGIRVREAREALGMTQEALAEKADKTPETISNLERGAVLTGITALERISASLGVPLASFFEGIERSKKLTPLRLREESRLKALCAQLSDGQLDLAISLVERLAKHPVSKKPSE